MRLLGYCEQCQRIRQVTVRKSMLAAGVIRGVCHDCEERERFGDLWICSHCHGSVRAKRRPSQCTRCGSLTSSWAKR